MGKKRLKSEKIKFFRVEGLTIVRKTFNKFVQLTRPTFLDTLNRKPNLYNWYFGTWIKVDQGHMFNLPDEVKIKISEKLIIQASAKYVNLGINLKTPLM